MKRILHVIDHLGLGGAQAVLFDLATLINPYEWHIEVAVLHGHGLFASALEEYGIKVHVLSPSVWPPSYIPAFLRLQPHFDLFHFHLSGANWISKPLAALAGDQPRIVHDHASDDLRFRGLASTFIDSVLHHFSSHTIAVAPEVKNFLMNYEGLSSDEVSVIPNGVNTVQFRPCSALEKKEARCIFDLEEEEYIIGTAGRLVPAKNQQLFLEAAQQAIKQGSKALFVIAGTGPEEAFLRKCASDLKITDRVQFLGQVTDRVSLYRALDLFALPSLYEGLPIVLLEAMASGTPVVSTDLEGVRYVLEEGLHGELVRSGDKAALAAAFLKPASHYPVESARARMESDFSAVQAAVAVTKLYEQYLGR